MKSKISITDCRRAIGIAYGIPLMIQGACHHCRGRPTPLIPPAPPTISIRECQKAIEIAGVIPITLRGEQMRITEIATRDISRWASGDIRFTPKEKELLTKRAPGGSAKPRKVSEPPKTATGASCGDSTGGFVHRFP